MQKDSFSTSRRSAVLDSISAKAENVQTLKLKNAKNTRAKAQSSGQVNISDAESNSAKLNQMNSIDYKNTVFLRRFITEQGKILSRRLTGIPAKHQRKIAKAIKHARLLGLLQFVHIK